MKLILTSFLLFAFFSCSQTTNYNHESNKEIEIYNGKALPKNVCSIIRDGGTERPFTGKYWDNHEQGKYLCVGCGSVLFSSENKYDSGSGWPSFYDILTKGSVRHLDDYELGYKRIEIRCKKCDAHLGHLFDDGPKPTGMRYCVNSAALDFVKE